MSCGRLELKSAERPYRLLECASAHANRREIVDAVRSLGAAARISTEAVALIPWARTLADELAEKAPCAIRRDAQQLRSTLMAVD